ncbi:hypothetical protein KI688_002323 [Linnemannia hyalina]|uniref:Uncharacterized protein n=1 Tax=Linnemannia hyalina TaxID=64524 RepID=A0A9P8BQJ5_9FUNG|nr:hypothetical protein KI688_002323 [Linnemannia hyalina]
MDSAPPLLAHAHHIRHLLIAERWLLSTAILSNITNLESLVFGGRFNEWTYPSNVFHLDEVPSEVTVPDSIFHIPSDKSLSKLYKRIMTLRSQLCWQLVFNNPHLRSIEFKSATSTPTFWGFKSTTEDAATEAYLLQAFSALTQVRHLELGKGIVEFVLPRLGRLFPHIITYVCPTVSFLEMDRTPFDSCSTLRTLRFHCAIRVPHLRSILKAFSGLQHLTLGGTIVGLNPVASNEIIEHSSLETLVTVRFSDLVAGKVRFRGLKKLTVPGLSHRELKEALSALPSLEYLLLSSYDDRGYAGDLSELGASKQDYPLQTFFCSTSHGNPTIPHFVHSMPHLVRLHLGATTGDLVAELGRTCRSLEWVHFDLQEPCYQEMNQLFVECPRLTHCLGEGHEVLSSDVLQEPYWACLGLQELHCAIRGVVRLTVGQEHVLDKMRHESRTEPEMNEEREAVNRWTESLSVQRQVYQRLALLTELTYLDIGFGQFSRGDFLERYVSEFDGGLRYRGRTSSTFSGCLELSLESGLFELGTLARLRTIGFQGVDHRIGLPEMLWMVARWPVKRLMGMEGYYVRQGGPDPQQEPRLESFLKLVPSAV